MKNSRNNLATPLEKEAEIMLYFRNSKNNSLKEIAEHFNMKVGTINDIIDRNLKKVQYGFESRKK